MGFTFMRYVIFALALLAAPAFAASDRLPQSKNADHRYCRTEIVKALHATLVFRSCPEMINWFRAVELARQQRMSKPCLLKRRVRSKADGRCYFKNRLP